jgi:hypothetical protein
MLLQEPRGEDVSDANNVNNGRRVAGIVIVIMAALGVLFGIASVIGLIAVRAPVLNAADTALAVVSSTLDLAEESAVRIDGIVVAGQEKLSAVEDGTREVAARLQDGRERLADRALGPINIITDTATETQVWVNDWYLMITSADRILGRLSTVGPLDLNYESPDRLLADIEELNALLTRIIDEGNQIGATVAALAEGPGPIGRRVIALADTIDLTQTKIDDTRAQIADYLQQLRALEVRAVTFVAQLPLLLTLVTLAFILLTAAGVVGLIKGLEMAGVIKKPL